MAPSPPDDQTINIPQLLLVLVISGFAIRYFFFTPSTPNSSHHARGANAAGNGGMGSGRQRAVSNGVRAREADVERIQQMFPQVDRRSIMWNLQRDGGNVEATAERILSGRGLEVPPQSFQPPLPPTSLPNPSSTTASSSTKSATANTPDLITRYNLASKLSSPSSSTNTGEGSSSSSATATLASAGARQAWSSNKGERQALLQRRREEMILAARRKMEAKVAAERGAAAAMEDS